MQPDSQRNSLETALAALREQPIVPPDDLHARCLATIPAPRRSWHLFGKDGFMNTLTLQPQRLFLRLVLAGAAVAALFLWSTQPHTGKFGPPTAASAALAQAIEATLTTPYWHKHSRYHIIEPGYNAATASQHRIVEGSRKPSVEDKWQESEEWFDINRGYVRTSPDLSLMTLPNGDEYASSKKGNLATTPNQKSVPVVDVVHKGVEFWAKLRDRLSKEIGDPYRMFGGNPMPKAKIQVTLKEGIWRSQPAKVFTVIPLNQTDTPGLWRQRIYFIMYADPQSGLFLAQEVFAQWDDFPDLGVANLGETVYDYDSTLAVHKFDPQTVTLGIKNIRDLYPDTKHNTQVDKDGNIIYHMPSTP